MSEVEELEKLQDIIGKINNSVRTYIIFNRKLNKPFLLAAVTKKSSKISLFAAGFGVSSVATLKYTIKPDRIFISSFEVNKQFQRNGLGKTIFNLALAHGDLEGATNAYGHAMPIDDIKGVPNTENYYEATQRVLYKIYEKLGCEFDFYGDNNTFTINWQSGDRFENLQDEFKEIAEDLAGNKKENSL